MKIRFILVAAILVCTPALALEPGENDAYIRVVDVGASLCAVSALPGGYYMVYDTGDYGSECLDAVREIVDGNTIHFLILSHSDADHIRGTKAILSAFKVRHIVSTGFYKNTTIWKKTNKAIAKEARYGATIYNLQTINIDPGESYPLGEATLTFIAGWPKWTETGPTASEKRNAISIVAKLTYKDSSVLFTGDTVGRRKEDPTEACKDAEKVMVDRHNAGTPSLKSDVIIAPHHGGNNGSSACFIAAVDPDYVIFSAGHKHDHPTEDAAERYVAQMNPDDDPNFNIDDWIFRTDLGDDEGGYEWGHGSEEDNQDGRGDEDVDILLKEDGTVEVAYR